MIHLDPLASLRDPSLVRTRPLIGGKWLEGRPRFEVLDPTTGKVLREVEGSLAADAIMAIDVADRAFAEWRTLNAKARSRILRDWFDLILANAEDLARILSAEQGKPLKESRGEIVYGASFVEWYAEEAKRVAGELLPAFESGRKLMVMHEPVGVCAAITPWNFPVAMITRKVAPALAAGCTVIVKPAEQTPLSALALAELAQRAGLPPGVLNVLPADSRVSMEIGEVLCSSPTVRHLSFTGSTPVGRLLMAQCAPTVKKLALELGGNAPFIVFDDADIERAVEGLLASKFRNAGQTCVCPNRIYVQAGMHDEFVSRLSAAADRLTHGDPFDDRTLLGPMIDASAVEKVQRHVDDAVKRGARLVTGGHAVDDRFFLPTVLDGVNESMQCFNEETFGPVASVRRFETEAEVLKLANDSESGLAAYIYTSDAARIFRMAEALECGMVGINTSSISTEQVPFGGIKQSGLGREGGAAGMNEYTEMKYLCWAAADSPYGLRAQN
jgi:succinate-semialdehyde dehydrogenase/glutarate-semialdehyde dehydrogenase